MYQHDLERGAWIRGIVLCMARRLICVGRMILGPRPIFYKMRTQAVAENGDFVLKSYGEIIWESTRDGDVRALQAMSGARRVPLSRYKIRRR
jgi:hypothetical protein